MKEQSRTEDKKMRTKPGHNTFQNVCWMLGNARQSCKTVPLWCVVRAGLTIGLQTAELFIAPQILKKVENAAPVSELLWTIAFFSGLIFVLTGLKKYIQLVSDWGNVEVSQGIMRQTIKKNLSTSYPNIFDPEIKKLRKKAEKTTNGDHEAAMEIWETLTSLLTNLGGFIIWLMILSRLETPLLVTVLVTAAAGFFAARRANAWQYAHEDNSFWVCFKYINRISRSVELAKDIRIFGLAGWLTDLQDSLMRFRQNWMARAEGHRLLAGAADIVLSMARNGIAYFYLIQMTLRNNLSASEFLLYFTAVSGFTAWITGILTNCASLHRQGLELNYERDYLSSIEPFRLEGGTDIPKAEAFELKLENVSFRYPGAEADALHHVNLTVRPGEKLAVVGLNGAGKTTLVKLLCGLLDPTEGRVLLNGRDIRDFSRPEYYRLFSAVFQDFSLLNVTVAENIAQTFENIDRHRVAACIGQAGLTEKVASLSKGLDTHVGREVWEDGVLFSGGETQRLMLARALCRDGAILVLDEPTAALDPLAENDLYLKYNEMTAGRTALFISHRLASTRFCDRILLIADGRIAEEGTHEELLKKGGMYAGLFEVQSRYYREGRDF